MIRKKFFEVGCLVIAALSSARLVATGNQVLGCLGYLCLLIYMLNDREGR